MERAYELQFQHPASCRRTCRKKDLSPIDQFAHGRAPIRWVRSADRKWVCALPKIPTNHSKWSLHVALRGRWRPTRICNTSRKQDNGKSGRQGPAGSVSPHSPVWIICTGCVFLESLRRVRISQFTRSACGNNWVVRRDYAQAAITFSESRTRVGISLVRPERHRSFRLRRYRQ